MKTLLFGTNNPNKLGEIREMLGDRFQILSPADLGLDFEVDETEDSFHGNALLKARAYASAAGMPCFADDSGLETDALDGAPGVYSARYAGPGCSYADNVEKLLREMQGKTRRGARFQAVIAYIEGEEFRFFQGTVEGQITEAPRGSNGFGYDPVFQPDGYDRTFAEMGPEVKHSFSHRGKAIRALVEYLTASHA
ncbi:MAG: RdgB/HAM1 family non-canonical purine NTP pyrophosphatase [Bacteroidetes bacterium]|nr:MAG: RdgB/HAM1 family non-canonical purine NTP pyrophosphatase [Bacteroidota bacterium]